MTLSLGFNTDFVEDENDFLVWILSDDHLFHVNTSTAERVTGIENLNRELMIYHKIETNVKL